MGYHMAEGCVYPQASAMIKDKEPEARKRPVHKTLYRRWRTPGKLVGQLPCLGLHPSYLGNLGTPDLTAPP